LNKAQAEIQEVLVKVQDTLGKVQKEVIELK